MQYSVTNETKKKKEKRIREKDNGIWDRIKREMKRKYDKRNNVKNKINNKLV